MRKTKSQLAVIGFLLTNILMGFVTVPQGATAWARSPKVTNEPVLKVGVYNYAGIGALQLREAEGEAGRVFARAGVRIAWVDCALVHEEVALFPQCSTRDVVLRILPASMTARLDGHAEALGESFAWTGLTRAWAANVFYSRVRNLSSQWNLDSAQVLGAAAAHELGHLLLGPGHASAGIMQAQWSPMDLRRASRRGLQFVTHETALLKDAVTTLRSKAAPLLTSGN